MEHDIHILSKIALSDCLPENAFWTTNGVVCRNIYELANNIESLNEHDFKYHVNNDKNKNDFAKWIEFVLKDKTLASRLQIIREKDRYVDVIRERINELEDA